MDLNNLSKEELIKKYRDLSEKHQSTPTEVKDTECYNLSFLVDILSSGAMYINTSGEIVEINEIMVEWLGSPSKESTKEINILTYPPLVASGFSEEVQNCLRTGDPKHGDQCYTTKWGRELFVRYNMSPVKCPSGEVKGVFISYDDVSEEKKALRRLTESEKKIRTIFNLVPTGIIILKDKVVVDANERVCIDAGVSPAEIKGKDPRVFFYSEEDFQMITDNLLKQISERGEGSVEIGLRKGNGERIPAILSGVPLQFADGAHGYIFSALDITEQKKNEEALKKAKAKAEESDHLKSAFLANMSHEIRTPMNGILGFAELLELPDLKEEEKKEYIEIIQKSGIRMLNIVNDLIDISKIEAGQVEISETRINVSDMIRDIYNFFAPEAKAKGLYLDYRICLDEREKEISTDQVKVEALLTNLIKNAIKYSESGKIEIGCIRKDNFLEFSIKDQGIGIASDKLKDIFIRFVQNDPVPSKIRQGAGLGLAIAKGYAEILGGEIRVESVLGEGSTFYFTIPCK